jgi:hypothetical protein
LNIHLCLLCQRLSQPLLNNWNTKWLLSWMTTSPNIEHKKYVKNLRLITKNQKKKKNYNISCSLICCSWMMFIHEHLFSSKMFEIHLSSVNSIHRWISSMTIHYGLKKHLITINFSFMDEVHYEHPISPIMKKKNHPSFSTFNPMIKFIKHKTFFIYNTWNSSTIFHFLLIINLSKSAQGLHGWWAYLVDSIIISLN